MQLFHTAAQRDDERKADSCMHHAAGKKHTSAHKEVGVAVASNNLAKVEECIALVHLQHNVNGKQADESAAGRGHKASGKGKRQENKNGKAVKGGPPLPPVQARAVVMREEGTHSAANPH